MKEIGGYIELENFNLPMLHEGSIELNCGRSCLAYLIRARGIKKILLPYFLCDSVKNLCERDRVETAYYHIDEGFMPENISLDEDEWLYVVNFYGQLTADDIEALKDEHGRVIVDNAQAYFDMPAPGVDTLYTCRKYFGVPDGAFLYTDARLSEELPLDESFERMRFLLGRYERTASEFYGEYAANNRLFAGEPLKKMSRLTCNLLHGIDYERVRKKRTENFKQYHEKLKHMNQLELRDVEGAFAYPLLVENGAEVRKRLIEKKIYVPTLWPNVVDEMSEYDIEHRFAKNILPLPVDQRYNSDDISFALEVLQNVRKA